MSRKARSARCFISVWRRISTATLATQGRVPDDVLEACRAFRKTERKLFLVTGRQLDDLKVHMPENSLFDRIVAENGGDLYEPAAERRRELGPRPPEEFEEALRARGVSPLSAGDVIVSTWEPNQQAVLDVIKELGLELQIIFNKGAVMVLPPGVNKASGLLAALAEMNISPHNIVGIGDAENDHAFLDLCEFSVAVANAIDALKEKADFVTRGERGAGVTELIEKLIGNDLADLDAGAD
jgi:HAD superfamily hydrolase (TIGR01484 family)